MGAVARHSRVSVRSGHKTGKSKSVAAIAFWFLATRRGARVVLTAPGARQIKSILWREIKLTHRQARVPLGGQLFDDPNTGFKLSDGREILGFSTREPERMAGISGENVLFIIDEASGVPEPIFEAIEGNRAGGASELLLSNPTRTSGEFYSSHRSKAKFYKALAISSEETPNVRAGKKLIPGLATKEWVDEKRKEWPKGSNLYSLYQVRVLGDFPDEASNAVIPLGRVSNAKARWAEIETEEGEAPELTGPLSVGLDVARGGRDNSIIQPVIGDVALPYVVVDSDDGKVVADRVIDVVRLLKKRHAITGKPRVNVDIIGVGASPFDFLRRSDEVDAFAVNVSIPSRVVDQTGAPRFTNLRAEIYFALADWLNTGALPPDDLLEEEMIAPLWLLDPKLRIFITPKDEIKGEIGRSTDRADALALSLYVPPNYGAVARTLSAANRAAPSRSVRSTW